MPDQRLNFLSQKPPSNTAFDLPKESLAAYEEPLKTAMSSLISMYQLKISTCTYPSQRQQLVDQYLRVRQLLIDHLS